MLSNGGFSFVCLLLCLFLRLSLSERKKKIQTMAHCQFYFWFFSLGHIHSIAKAGLELLVQDGFQLHTHHNLLLQLPKHWDYRCEPPHLVQVS